MSTETIGDAGETFSGLPPGRDLSGPPKPVTCRAGKGQGCPKRVAIAWAALESPASDALATEKLIYMW